MMLVQELEPGTRFKSADTTYVLLRVAEGSSLVRREGKRDIVIGGEVVGSVNERPYRIGSTTEVDEVLGVLDVAEELVSIYTGTRKEDTTEADAKKALRHEERKKKARGK